MKYLFLGLLAIRYQLLNSVFAAPPQEFTYATAGYLPDIVNNTILLPNSTTPLSPLK